MPRGGKRPGAGRPKGSRDAATIEQKATISELARSHTAVAIKALVSIAKKSDSDAARVSAAVAILDRGYGKPVQAMEHSGKEGGPPIKIESLTDAQLDILIERITSSLAVRASR